MATDIFQFQGTIKLRRGLAIEWNQYNPLLAEGEFGVELDTRMFKIGNGVDLWRALPYAGEPGVPGLPGTDGDPGRDGTDGMDGIDGAVGPRGETGKIDAQMIIDLPLASELLLSDVIPILQNGNAAKATVDNLREAVVKADNIWTGYNQFKHTPIIDIIDLSQAPQIGQVVINWNDGGFTKLKIGGNLAISFGGVFDSGGLYEMRMEIDNVGAGNIVSWPANIRWPAGGVVSLTPDGIDFLRFITVDGGQTFQAFVLGQDMKGA